MKEKEVWLTGKERTIRIVLTPRENKTEAVIYDSAVAYVEEEVWNLPLPQVEKILKSFYKDFLK